MANEKYKTLNKYTTSSLNKKDILHSKIHSHIVSKSSFYDMFKSSQKILGDVKFNDIFSATLADNEKQQKKLAKKLAKETDETVLCEAVQNDPSSIQHIENPSEIVQVTAVTIRPESIQHIKDPTKMVEKLAVSKKPSVIVHIQYPSEELQGIAIKKDPEHIRFFATQATECIKEETIKMKPICLKYIENPSDNLIMLAVDLNLDLDFLPSKLSEQVQIFVVRKNPNEALDSSKASGLITSKKAWEIAIRRNPELILSEDARFNTERFREIAFQANPFLISELSNTYQTAAIQKKAFSYINQDEDIEEWVISIIDKIKITVLRKAIDRYPGIMVSLICFYSKYLPEDILRGHTHLSLANEIGLFEED